MGLQREYIHKSGATINYWNIGEIKLEKPNKYCCIVMYGYIEQGLNQPLEKRFIHAYVEDYDNYFSIEQMEQENILKAGYKYVKDNEEFFQDAIDILEEV